MDQEFLEGRKVLVCIPSVRGEHQLPQILVFFDHYYSFVFAKRDILHTPFGLRLAGKIFRLTLCGR